MVILLMRYTLEVDPKSSERPMFMPGQIGGGVIRPKGDIRVILRARKWHDD